MEFTRSSEKKEPKLLDDKRSLKFAYCGPSKSVEQKLKKRCDFKS